MGKENFEFKISGGTGVLLSQYMVDEVVIYTPSCPDPECGSQYHPRQRRPAELAVILTFMLRLNRNSELRT